MDYTELINYSEKLFETRNIVWALRCPVANHSAFKCHCAKECVYIVFKK